MYVYTKTDINGKKSNKTKKPKRRRKRQLRLATLNDVKNNASALKRTPLPLYRKHINKTDCISNIISYHSNCGNAIKVVYT